MILNSKKQISENEIKKLLGEDIFVKVFESTDSTNNQAKKFIYDGFQGNGIVAAIAQTSGRGRQGKSFYSPDKTGLYFSLVLRPSVSLADSTSITAAAAVAVADVIKEATKKDPKIKWVNDIFLNGKKVCGILTEAVTDQETGNLKAVVVGIGVNITTTDFPHEISEIAGSLECEIHRNEFIVKVYDALNRICKELPQKGFMEKYRAYSLVLGNTVHFVRNGKEYTALGKYIRDDGTLEVVTDNGDLILLNSGEISVKLG